MSHCNKIFKTVKSYVRCLGAIGTSIFALSTISCETGKNAQPDRVYLTAAEISDSIKVTDVGTNIEIGSLIGKEKIGIPMPYSKIGKLRINGHNSTYLAFLEPVRVLRLG